MSIEGKSASGLSTRRRDFKQQRVPATNIQNITFAHQATAGDSAIYLNALVAPQYGYNNPSPQQLLNANLGFYRQNFLLFSSLRGWLNPEQSYKLSASSITFVGFTAEQDECFFGMLMSNPSTGLTAVDARPIVVTGELAVGATDFYVGPAFRVNYNPNYQVGEILWFRNGLPQFRCEGNNISNVGNFIELSQGDGEGSVIRFKNAAAGPNPDAIIGWSVGYAEKPQSSQLAEIERVAGQVERLIPYVAALAGVPQSELRTYNPTNIDLKNLGDQVLANTQAIANYVGENLSALRQYILTVSGTNAWVTERAVGVPYRTLDGSWRMKFNIVGSHSSAASTTLTVTGVVFKTTGVTINRQAVVANDNSGGSAPSNCFAIGTSATIQIVHAAANTQNTVSGDVELDGKPSFVP